MAEYNKMDKIIQFIILGVILVHTMNTAPINTDSEDVNYMEEESDRNISDEVFIDEDGEPGDTEIVTTREKRYFDNFLENQSMEERRQRIHLLKQKNMRDQRRRKEQRKKKLRKNGKRKLRVNRNTSSEKCVTNSPAHLVKLLLMIHSQKVRDRVAGQWLRDCSGDRVGQGARRSIRTSSVRYFG